MATQAQSKRRRQEDTGLAPHPLGIKPLGNLLFDGGVNCRNLGLGRLCPLSDEQMLTFISLLTPLECARWARLSRACYAFAKDEEFWKQAVLRDFGGDFQYGYSWCQTYRLRYRIGSSDYSARNVPLPLRLTNFYSDELFAPWIAASVPIDPAWIKVDNIPRRAGLSVEEFRRDFELPNRPVVLTDQVGNWPAFRDKRWHREELLRNYGDTAFTCRGVEMKLNTLFTYCDRVKEEMPLYCFDKDFGAKAPPLLSDYAVPEIFREDLFSVLGTRRPNFRWWLVGPARSGSTWHTDPNGTSAWNGVVYGRKKWIMFPPGPPPPGVFSDGVNVTVPVSIIEWFIKFYAHTQAPLRDPSQPAPIECVLKPGELIFVPSGWWHCVLNLDEGVAITQNFVSRANLCHVLTFLRGPIDTLSGTGESDVDDEELSAIPLSSASTCASNNNTASARVKRAELGVEFEAALNRAHPGLIDEAMAERAAAQAARLAKTAALSHLFRSAPSPPLDCAENKRPRVGDHEAAETDSSLQSEPASAAPSGGFSFNFTF